MKSLSERNKKIVYAIIIVFSLFNIIIIKYDIDAGYVIYGPIMILLIILQIVALALGRSIIMAKRNNKSKGSL